MENLWGPLITYILEELLEGKIEISFILKSLSQKAGIPIRA